MLKEDLVIGRKYVVNNTCKDVYDNGDILRFVGDDGTDCPEFWNETKGNIAFCYYQWLEPLENYVSEPVEEEGVYVDVSAPQIEPSVKAGDYPEVENKIVTVPSCINCYYNSYPGSFEPCSECRSCNKWLSKDDTPSLFTMEQKQAQELPNPHYQTDIQPIEFMQANMSPEAFQGYLRGNIMKYTARIGKKDESLKEAKKIADYSRWLVLAVQGIKIDPRKD